MKEEKDKILGCHLEWKGLHTVLSQRCKSKLKCGSENANLQEPPKVEEVYRTLNEFELKNSLHEKYTILKQVDERSDMEYYYHLKYKAYMKGLMKLRIKNFQEELSAAVEKILSEMKFILVKNFPEPHQLHTYAKNLNSETLISIIDRKNQEDFENAYAEYVKLRLERINKIKQQRAKEKGLSVIREGLASLYKKHELKMKQIDEEHKHNLTNIDLDVSKNIVIFDRTKRKKLKDLRKKKDYKRKRKKDNIES
jgi:hypothetical protein